MLTDVSKYKKFLHLFQNMNRTFVTSDSDGQSLPEATRVRINKFINNDNLAVLKCSVTRDYLV